MAANWSPSAGKSKLLVPLRPELNTSTARNKLSPPRPSAQDGLDVVAGAGMAGGLVVERLDLEAEVLHRLGPVVAELLAADVVEALAEHDRRAVDRDRHLARQLAHDLRDAGAVDLIED